MTREQLINLKIEEASDDVYFETKRVLDNFPKPVDGFGKFEDIMCKIACAQNTSKPCIDSKVLLVMCSDNGIVEEGITQTGAFVTGLTTRNIAHGKAIVNYMADKAGVKVIPVDMGVNGDVDGGNLIRSKIAKGTRNFVKDPAMTEEQFFKAVESGIEIVKDLKDEGVNIICSGDVGIGNTTTAAAVICAIIEGDPAVLTGKSAALSEIGYIRKVEAIAEGLHIYGYDKLNFSEEFDDANPVTREACRVIDIVTNLGGFDIAALIGVFIAGAMYRIPIVVDGIVTAAAALVAENIIPGCKKYMIGSYMGKEPASELVFQELSLEPVITSDMFMGEGSGAIMLMPILDMLFNVYNNLSWEEGPDMEQ